MAKVPFSDEIAFLVLEKLKSAEFVQAMVDDLRQVFKARHTHKHLQTHITSF